MQHRALCQATAFAQPAISVLAACLDQQIAYPRESLLPIAAAPRRMPLSASAEMQGNWDGLLAKVMSKLEASVDGLGVASEIDVAPGEFGVRAGVMECVEALEQLRQAMASHSEQRTVGERRSQFAMTRATDLARVSSESGDGATDQVASAESARRQPQLAVDRARKEMTDYMAVVAHELRNPLVPIRTAAAALGRVRAEELPRLQVIIERQVSRIAGLIADLVDIARLDSGKLRLQRQVVDMRAIVTEAVDDCRPAMSARSQHLEVCLPPLAIDVDGDSGRLVQIVSNLLDNASKYTPIAGVVCLSIARAGDSVNLTVSDNGIGISAGALPRLFERFVQESHAADYNRVGLGIGLAVVRELVQAHGGAVEAHSEGLGRGSQFIVTLPAFPSVQGGASRC